MPAPPPHATTVVLLAASAADRAPVAAERAQARGEIAAIVRVEGPFATLAPAFADAVRRCQDDLILVLTPDADFGRSALRDLRAAAEDGHGASVFVLEAKGLAADPAWRGRRCRSHERNVESLRFAELIAPGGLAAWRHVLEAAAEGLPAGDGWWRELVRRMSVEAGFARVPVTVRRRARLPGEPPCPGFAPPTTDGRPRVRVLGQIEVSTSLYFDVLEAQDELDVGFRPLTDLGVDAPHLAGADLVILVRELHRFWDEGVIDFLRRAGVPFVYFTDDNFLALQVEASGAGFYTAARMRRALAGAAELWASTPALAAALAPLHPRQRVWGPALDPPLVPRPLRLPRGRLTIALAGGDFRLGGLEGGPLAQLRALGAQRPLRLVASEAAAGVLRQALPDAEIVRMPMQRSFRQFIRRWRDEAPDLLLHPAGATANAPYKCPTAVVVAGYLGAVPVVADEPAYEGWGEAEGVLRIGEQGLADAARRVDDHEWRAEMRGRLAGALELRFNGLGRVEVLRDVLGAPRAEAGVAAADVLASPGFGMRQAGRRLVRLTRRLRDRIGARQPG
ncbi:MAG TPA: hypothetical protein VGG29_07320 [Caulobacteraceae bacterium]|jgi:hypothetical protein